MEENKIIRWTFFFEEGNVKTDVDNEEQDEAISQFVEESNPGLLRLPGDEVQIFVNMSRVKCTVRQIVDKEAERIAMEKAQAQQAQLEQQATN